MQDDKKKLGVLVVLVVLMLGIGAFSMIPQSTPAPSSSSSGWKPPVTEDTSKGKRLPNPAVAPALVRRDPFNVPPEGIPPDPNKVQTPNPTPQPLKGNFPNIPGPLPGPDIQIRPLNPKGEPTPAGNSAPPKVEEKPLDYTLRGVILGRQPAGVFADKQGNQRLVVQGGQLDADTLLIEVRPQEAVVKYRGRKVRIPMQGDTVEK